MNWFFWIIVILVVIIVLRWYMLRPYRHKNKTINDFKRFISSLLEQMTERSYIVFDHADSKGFLQLALNTYSDSNIILEFGFPEVPWSEKHFQEIVDYVNKNEFENIIERETEGEVKRFLTVLISCPEEEIVDKTYKLMLDVTNILGWKETDKYVIHFEGQLDRRVLENTLKGLQNLPDSFIKRKLVKYNKNMLKKK